MASKILVVSDFDGTITTKDTSYLSLKSTRPYLTGSSEHKKELMLKWNTEGVNYYTGYVQLLDSYLTECVTKNDYSMERLDKLLEILDSYNLNSRRHLADQKYFEETENKNLSELVKEIQFHPSALKTLEKFQKHQNIHCKILSINWFPALLYETLDGLIETPDIITSDLPVLKGGVVGFGKVATCYEKREWLRKWKLESNSVTVYLGDSLTDLLSLLEANYGIIIGSANKVCEVAKQFGVNVFRLTDLPGKFENLPGKLENINTYDDNDKKEKYLYCTDSWTEVETFIMTLV